MNQIIPKVSIVTLTYRKFIKLYDTMLSVFAQDYGNIEYIICDDGSEAVPVDRINKIVGENAKSGVSFKLLRNPENLGTVKSINRAYREATGNYILNLSCGDVFFTDSVVSQIVSRFIETNAKVIVTTRLFYENNYQPLCFLPHYEERRLLNELDTSLKQYKAFILSRYYDMASGSAMYFRSDVIKKHNYFDERYRLWEDGPFLAKFLWENTLEMAYDIVSIWYEKGGISTNTNNPVSQLLRKDEFLFALGEKLEHLDCFTEEEKEIIEYNNKRLIASNKFSLWFLRLKYFSQSYSNFKYKRQRERFKPNDLVYIKELFDKNKDKILPKSFL